MYGEQAPTSRVKILGNGGFQFNGNLAATLSAGGVTKMAAFGYLSKFTLDGVELKKLDDLKGMKPGETKPASIEAYGIIQDAYLDGGATGQLSLSVWISELEANAFVEDVRDAARQGKTPTIGFFIVSTKPKDNKGDKEILYSVFSSNDESGSDPGSFEASISIGPEDTPLIDIHSDIEAPHKGYELVSMVFDAPRAIAYLHTQPAKGKKRAGPYGLGLPA